MSRHRKPWMCRTWLYLHVWDCDPETCDGNHTCRRCSAVPSLEAAPLPVPGGEHAA